MSGEALEDRGRAATAPAALALLSALAFIVPWVAIGWPRAMAALFPLAAFAAALCYAIARRRLPLPGRDLTLVFALISVLLALSALLSPDLSFALERAAKIAGAALAALLGLGAVLALRPGTAGLTLKAALAGTLIAIFWLALELAAGPFLHPLVRGAALGSDPVVLNRAAVTLACLVWVGVFAALKLGRPLAAAALIVATVILGFLSHSGSAAAAAPLAALVFLAALWRPGAAAVALGVAGLAAFWFAPLIPDMIFALGGLKDAFAHSAQARLVIWDEVAVRIPQAPLFGHGLEAARLDRFALDQQLHPGTTIHHPHNAALQIWYEQGLAGILILSTLWVALLTAVARLPRRRAAVALAMIAAFTAISFVSHGLWQSWWLATAGVGATLFALIARAQMTGRVTLWAG